jgi:predicted amidophosphoribosyltransferase
VPGVAELTAGYGNFMAGPRCGEATCDVCFNLTDGYGRCYACSRLPSALDAVLPISYSVGGEQLHYALSGYKRFAGPTARRFTVELAAVLWRFLRDHERCLAKAVGVERFAVVATVPSSDRARDEHHPLRTIVGTLVGATRERHERLLLRSVAPAPEREFSAAKYAATRPLDQESVLLIDDTWTTGASAQSAAATLRSAGAGSVGAVVIGRYLNRAWQRNDRRLRAMPATYDWSGCAMCAGGHP